MAGGYTEIKILKNKLARFYFEEYTKIMINITSKNFEITDSINTKIRQNLEKLYNLISADAGLDVVLERTTNHHKKGDVYKIHLVVKAGSRRYNAEVHGENIYSLIDELQLKIEREIKEGGEKKRVKDRNFARKIKSVLKNINPFGRD